MGQPVMAVVETPPGPRMAARTAVRLADAVAGLHIEVARGQSLANGPVRRVAAAGQRVSEPARLWRSRVAGPSD